MYDRKTFTYGQEIEWGDIRRDLPIPSNLGWWEYSETDIINSRPPYKHVAADPLGTDPPVGGEINTFPTHTWEEQLNIFWDLYYYFKSAGCEPSVSFMSHTHIHIHVPGLSDDVTALKRLAKYVKDNQAYGVAATLDFQDHQKMSSCPGATTYFKYDGGRLMPTWMCDNIINRTTSFADFIRLHAAGKDGVSMGRPFRYAVNMYCLKHTDTVEFRHFRPAATSDELSSIFRYGTEFLWHALNDGEPVVDWLKKDSYVFPKMSFDPDAYMTWHATKHDKSRGRKDRKYVHIS